MDLTLVVLAAGLGSRYGGLKQLDPVGPGGEIILDYSLFDARRAGFDRVVFVIRRETETAFRQRFDARIPSGMAVDYAFQSTADVPPGYSVPANREKPWGTGHAVWCARSAVDGPFAVINADDFYGQTAFKSLAAFLIENPEYALVGYRLANTLSEHGLVSRGICEIAPGGELRGIVENKGIARADVGAGRKFTGSETVSMNCWGFTPTLFPALEREFNDFLRARADNASAEFYLPTAISTLIARGEAIVAVLPTSDSWFGVTYREDRPKVEAALSVLARAGTYPPKLQ